MSWSRPLPLMVATLAMALALPASAQRKGTIELGAFARYSVYDTDIGLDEAPGLGARFGWYVGERFALEADGGLIPTKASGVDVDNIPVHLRLMYDARLTERIALLFGLGWAYNQFSNGGSEAENGAGGLLGLRLRLSRRIAVRGDITADYMFDQAIAADPNLHYGVQAGVSLLLFSGPGDKDKDGVRDDSDTCADTPQGTAVNASGCPDADRDGVADQGDRCANTTAGAAVDAVGCTDADGDGVVDPQDRCANTAAGTQVDATGCAADADRDGVPDTADQCSNTAAGVSVNQVGCPVDSDGDGVSDPADRCPGTAAGVPVDAATGCPQDADGDGVSDTADRCAATPANTPVDAAGCPAVAAIVLEGVNFLSGSARLTLDSQGPLNQAASRLAERSDLRFVIEGHTDNVGNRDANIRLSKARADAVRAYFISKGIAANRMTTVGIGPDQPVASNDTPEGRAQNRRVQVRPQQ